MAFVAELRRGHGEHAPELAAADDPDGGAGCKCHSGLSAMPSVWRRRQASSLSARASSAVARIAAAISPALAAPALPIASVLTGMPAGIWTMERRLSMRDRAFDSDRKSTRLNSRH